MAELVAAIPLGQLSINGVLVILVVAVVWAIFTGRLVPEKTHLRELQVRDTQIVDLTKTRDTLSETVTETTRQNTQLINSLSITNKVLEAIRGESGVPNGTT